MRVTSAPTPVRVAALCAFVGWLPQLAVGPYFLARVRAVLGASDRTLLYLYDAGHVLGLAVLSALLVTLLWRLPLGRRVAVSGMLLLGACYLLLGDDLDSWNKRHVNDGIPWRWLFALASALGFTACLIIGRLFSGRRYLRWLTLLGALLLAIANHARLELDFRGLHLILAASSAAMLGAGVSRWLADVRLSSAVRRVLLAVSAVSLLSYAVIPNHVVRRTLLASYGAIAAPHVTRLWWGMERLTGTPALDSGFAASTWLQPRLGLPPIAADEKLVRPEAPIVILVTVDSLREDAVLAPAYRKQQRTFSAMVGNGLRFTRVWSPAPNTRTSLSSLFLGRLFSHHDRGPDAPTSPYDTFEWPERASSQGPFLAAELERAGVRTVNFASFATVRAGAGVAEGFGKVVDVGNWASTRKVADEITRELRRQPKGPLFMFTHLLEAHVPYDCGKVVGTDKQRYMGEVRCVDSGLGRLRAALKELRLDKRTYLIVSADHGEGFKEHGRSFHAATLYEELLHVPLLIEGPGIRPSVIDQRVSLLDLAPTILSLFGLPTPATFMGESLVPFMRNERPPLTRPIAADSELGMQSMLFDGHMKAIIDLRYGTEELYDLRTDPGELRNLADRDDARAYFAKLHTYFAARPAAARQKGR